jgi:hypothetical protein
VKKPLLRSDEFIFVTNLAKMTDSELLTAFRRPPVEARSYAKHSLANRLTVQLQRTMLDQEIPELGMALASPLLDEHFRRLLSSQLRSLDPSAIDRLLDFESRDSLPLLRLFRKQAKYVLRHYRLDRSEGK